MREEIEKRFGELLAPIAEGLGVSVYDVEYVKEAGENYLRAYIDKEGGVTIDDCEAVSRALDAPLDAADFISEEYILEVSSPGLTRKLTKDSHFEKSMGLAVDVLSFKPRDGKKEWTGTLEGFTKAEVSIRTEEEGLLAFPRKELAYVKLRFEI